MPEPSPFLKNLIKIIIVLICLLLAVSGGIYYWMVIVDDPVENYIEGNNIYLVDGRMVKDKEAKRIEYTFYDEIPEDVVNAFVAMEDSRFFGHGGVDIIGVMRAFIANLSSNELLQGGSTITQQLAKNLFLEHDRTVERKLTEIRIALSLENKYSKEEILDMYLSQIYFGHGNWGIKQAARSYFQKDVNNLTLAEGAALAGIIQAPNVYAPISGWNITISRQNIVLERMLELKLINSDEASKAKTEASLWQ